MIKKKKHTIDAQDLKRSMHEAADKIGKRKRITAGQFFELVCDAMSR